MIRVVNKLNVNDSFLTEYDKLKNLSFFLSLKNFNREEEGKKGHHDKAEHEGEYEEKKGHKKKHYDDSG